MLKRGKLCTRSKETGTWRHMRVFSVKCPIEDLLALIRDRLEKRLRGPEFGCQVVSTLSNDNLL
jgi:hypothetical protein